MNLKSAMEHNPVIGIFSKTTDSALVEAAGLSGLDFVILDQEHGPVSLDGLHHHVRAARLTRMQPIIRVKDVDAHGIGAALDTGAAGVQVPNINTAAQARAAVAAARFYPVGQRGVCRFVRAAGFGKQEKRAYFDEANQALLILQVEGIKGVENLDEILNVPGFDVLFVGPYDLSQSAGKPGEVTSPEVLDLINIIADKANEKEIVLGAFCDTLESADLMMREGFRYIAYSVDINLFQTQIQTIVDAVGQSE